MNKLIQISTPNVHLAWPEAMQYIERALLLTPEYRTEDIYNLIMSETLTLWMFYNEKKKKAFGAMVTEVVRHPHSIKLSIFLMAADDFKEVKPLFIPLLDYAKFVKADSIECCGRFGLEKLLASLGFKKSYIVMNYDVN